MNIEIRRGYNIYNNTRDARARDVYLRRYSQSTRFDIKQPRGRNLNINYIIETDGR